MSSNKKELNLFNIISLGAGGAIGSGIFVMMGTGIDLTGKSISIALVAGCILMLLAYTYNFMLASMFKLDGGMYSQQALLCPPLLTGVCAVNTIVGNLGMAMYAVAIVDYVGVVFPDIVPYTKVIAILIQTVLFAATIRGIKFLASIQSIMAIILFVSIGVFIVCGLPQVDFGVYMNTSDPNFFRGGLPGFVAAVSIMSWACQGTTMSTVSVAAETKDAKKTIPIGIMISTVIVCIVYTLMGIVASGVLPIEKVAGKSLGLVAESIFPRSVYVIFILGGAVFAIFTSLISSITMIKHPFLATVRDGWMPKVFGKQTKDGYPYIIMGFMYLVAVVPIILGNGLDVLVSYVMIPSMVVCGLCNFWMIKVPKQYPKRWKESVFHMPYPIYVGIMLISVVCNIFISYNLFVGLTGSDRIMVSIITLGMFAISYFRLKGGYVNLDSVNKIKEQAQRDVLAD